MAAILVSVVLLIYANTLHSPFVLDDASNIVHNPYIRISSFDLAELSKIFSEFQPSKTRPVANLSFALNYLAGGYNPAGYHLVNILIHVITALLVFRLFFWYFGRDAHARNDALVLSFAAALLWAVNPMQTNAVTYVIQRMTSLCTLFFVASLLCYLSAREAYAQSGKYGRETVLFSAASLLCWVLALLSKEIAAIMPVVVLLHERLFFARPGNAKRAGKILLFATVFLAAALPGLWYMGSDIAGVFIAPYADRDFTPYERLLTETRVIVRYITLFLYPLPERLKIYYDFPVSHSLLSPPSTLYSLLALVALLAAAVYSLRRSTLISLGLFWMLVCLLIESTLLPLELIFEHRFYLPSIGFSLFLVVGMHKLLVMKYSCRHIFYFIILLFTLSSSIGTFLRNSDWSSEEKFYKDAISKSPNDIRLLTTASIVCFNRKDFESGFSYLDKAYQLDKRNIDVLSIYFSTYYFLKMNRNLEHVYNEIASSIKGGNFRCTQNASLDKVGQILFRKNRFDEVIFILETLKKCRIKPPVFYYNLAESYARAGKYDGAIENYTEALRLDPANSQYMLNLANIYILAGDRESGARLIKALQAAKLNSDMRAEVKRLELSLGGNVR